MTVKICVAKTACMDVTELQTFAINVKSVNMEVSAQYPVLSVVATKDAKLKTETVTAVPGGVMATNATNCVKKAVAMAVICRLLTVMAMKKQSAEMACMAKNAIRPAQ